MIWYMQQCTSVNRFKDWANLLKLSDAHLKQQQKWMQLQPAASKANTAHSRNMTWGVVGTTIAEAARPNAQDAQGPTLEDRGCSKAKICLIQNI